MNPIKILVAGIANPHIPGYCRGFANTPGYPWQIVALAESDPGRMAMAQRILAGKEVKFYDETEDTVCVSVKVNEQAMIQFAKSYAPDVVILGPEKLKERVKEELRMAYDAYMSDKV